MKEVNYRDAWAAFYTWVQLPENWAALSPKQKNRIYNAQRDYNGKTKNKEGRIMRLGYERTKDLITSIRPGWAEFKETVLIDE